MNRILTNTDDFKVNAQDKRDNQNFINFANGVLPDYTVTFTEPDNLYNDYDLTMSITDGYKSTDVIVEIKERKEHYSTYMIDVEKINKLQNDGRKAILVILEPLNNVIYIFNISKIDWETIDRKPMRVAATTLRSYNEVRVTKEFFFVPFNLAKRFEYDEWG